MGLIAGWLAGMVMTGGGGGSLGDLVVGLDRLVPGRAARRAASSRGRPGFWGSIVVAFIGACAPHPAAAPSAVAKRHCGAEMAVTLRQR